MKMLSINGALLNCIQQLSISHLPSTRLLQAHCKLVIDVLTVYRHSPAVSACYQLKGSHTLLSLSQFLIVQPEQDHYSTNDVRSEDNAVMRLRNSQLLYYLNYEQSPQVQG